MTQQTGTPIKPSRRNFLKGAGVALAGTALASLTGCAPSSQVSSNGATSSADSESWDEEFDVVVVGAGLAGATAAVTVATEGNGETCLLIEKGAMPTGNSAYSLGVSHRTDDVETFKKYVTNLMGDRSTTPQDVIDAYCEGTAENLEWVKGLNPDLDAMYITEPNGDHAEGHGGEYPEFEGSESIAWFGLGINDELAGAPDDNDSPHMPQFMLQKAQEYPDVVTYRTQTTLTDLVQDPTSKAILGIVTDDGTRIKANKGVIMALGGFENNPTMLEDYMGQGGALPCIQGGNTGDGIPLCLKVGADLWHMHCAGLWMGGRDLQNTTFTVSGLEFNSPMEHGICVSTGGRRFYMDWDGYRTNNNDALLSNLATNVGSRHGQKNFGGEWTPLPLPSRAWFIFDEAGRAAGAVTDEDPVGNGICVTANTIEELAEQIDVPVDELVKTVSTWNTFCENGEDLAFYRPADRMAPLSTPPYYAQLCIPMFQNTMGGPRRSARGEILNPDGEAIPGLYSAGEFGSIWGHNYNGGGNISECLVFGRISARSCLSN